MSTFADMLVNALKDIALEKRVEYITIKVDGLRKKNHITLVGAAGRLADCPIDDVVESLYNEFKALLDSNPQHCIHRHHESEECGCECHKVKE